MKSINKIFVELDNLLKAKRELSLELNKGDHWAGSIGDRFDYNPEGLSFKDNEKYPLLHQTTEPDHNKYFNVFLFHTTNIYRHTSGEHLEEFSKTTEFRKVLHNADGVEVGISIENKIRCPNDTVWGYSFGMFEYYIIKDNKTTFSNSRSVIRKIYNSKDVEAGCDVIRFENSRTFLSTEIIDVTELFDRKVFHVNTVDGDFVVGNTDDIWKWIYDMYDGEEYLDWWVKEYADEKGEREIIKDFFAGRSFDKNTYLWMTYEIKDLLSYKVIELEENWTVNACTWDIDNAVKLAGMNVFQIEV